MTLYVKKPVPVESRQWTYINLAELQSWTKGYFRLLKPEHTHGDEFTAEVFDKLHDKWIPLRTLDYVIQGAEGEFYPVKLSVFHNTYMEYQKPGPRPGRLRRLIAAWKG